MCQHFRIILIYVAIFALNLVNARLEFIDSPNKAGKDEQNKQVEYMITKIVSEFREENRKLQQVLESHTNEVKNVLGGFRRKLGKFEEAYPSELPGSSLSQANNGNLEHRFDNLTTEVQVGHSKLQTRLDSLTSKVQVGNDILQQRLDNLKTSRGDNLERRFDNLEQRLDNITKVLAALPTQTNIVSALPGKDENGLPKDCKEVQQRDSGISKSGIYVIKPTHSKSSFQVLCDMETRDGGWTHIHKRYDGSQDFAKTWIDYKIGFGNLSAEFWLGLQHIHDLTGYEVNELLIELISSTGPKVFALYKGFSIGSEEEGYALRTLGLYDGNTKDSLKYSLGEKFSTKDVDQDSWQLNCAELHGGLGGWWYKGCLNSNLNGKYQGASSLSGRVRWMGFDENNNIGQAKMMVRSKKD